MLHASRAGRAALAAIATITLSYCGCTSPREYLRNGFKVGPDYCRPAAAVAEHWIDADDIRTREGDGQAQWWSVFNDPTLNRLVVTAYRQNLSLREAGCRVLEARAWLGVAQANLLPQKQDAFGGYERDADSVKTSGAAATSPRFFDQWNTGFSLAWELDFWGRFRRAVAAADARLDASVEDYDDVLVTLLGDVASNYVQVRTLQERVRLLRRNVELQRWVRDLMQQWLDKGFRATKLDLAQAVSNLEQTEAAIPELEIGVRQATNRLCVLLGMPPADLHQMLGEGAIPAAPPELAIGIPAELLRRRPDVRRAERQAAAQAEMIGIAEAELYPAFSITGTLGYQAENFTDLFSGNALSANVGPSFQWNILNYGRIVNHVRFQDARFQELVATYRDTVLRANEEAENGLVTFLRAQKREGHLAKSADAADDAVETMLSQYRAGRAEADFNRYALIEQNRVQQQDLLAQSRGEIAQGLIQVYRALGGGWEIRLGGGPATPAETAPPEPPGPPKAAEKALPPSEEQQAPDPS